jgi:hypothetical protein
VLLAYLLFSGHRIDVIIAYPSWIFNPKKDTETYRIPFILINGIETL